MNRFVQAFCDSIYESAEMFSFLGGNVSIGNRVCSIHVSGTGNATQDVLRAFALSTALDNDFTLHVLSREDLPALPPFEWARKWIERHEIVPDELTYPYRIFFDRNTGTTYVYNRESRHGIVHTRRRSETDLRGQITPFRLMWSWMAASVGASIIHASGVQTPHGVVLFSGPSGSGKSTIAMSLALTGCRLLSDDCLWIEGNNCFPVFNRAKLPGDSPLIDQFAARGLSVERFQDALSSKTFISVDQINMGHMTSGAAKIILFPKTWPDKSWLPISSREAYLRMESDSAREVFGSTASAKISIAQICRQTRNALLWLGPNQADNVEYVLDRIQEAQVD